MEALVSPDLEWPRQLWKENEHTVAYPDHRALLGPLLGKCGLPSSDPQNPHRAGHRSVYCDHNAPVVRDKME